MESHQSRLSQLTAIIQSETEKIDEHVRSFGKRYTSMDFDSSPSLDLPEDLIAVRNSVIAATEELNYLMTGPMQSLTDLNASLHFCINALSRYPLATSIPIGGTASIASIAESVGLGEQETGRIIRTCITHRIFQERTKGVISHSAMSAIIAQNPGLRQWLGMASEDSRRSVLRITDAMARWPGSGEVTETGYQLAYDTDEGYFASLRNDPARATRFDEAMSFRHSGGGAAFERHLLCETYPWPDHDGALVVDVGGGQAAMCVDLARRYPRLRLVNQDLPHVIDGIKPLPDNVRDRVELMPHDFFTPQTVKGADVYLLRWILHDWPDGKAVKILQALVPALKPGSRIVLGEVCLPEPNTVPLFIERKRRYRRAFDVAMKATFNGLERDSQQFEDLFTKSDPRFRFKGVTGPRNSRFSIIEAIWEGQTYFN